MTFTTKTLTAVMALGIGAGAAMAQDSSAPAAAPVPAATTTTAPAATPAPAASTATGTASPSISQQPEPVPGAVGEPPIADGSVPATPAGTNAVTGTAHPAAETLVNEPAVGEADIATPPVQAPTPATPTPEALAPEPAAPATPAVPEPVPEAPAPAAPAEPAAPEAAAPAPAETAPPAAEAPAPAAETAPAPEAPAAGEAAEPAAEAAPASHDQEITDVAFSFEGPFGKFDQFQLQRGLQVYTEVCAACHGMRYVPIRTLSDPSGPGLPEDQVRAYAATMDIDDAETGESRPRVPTDNFPHNTAAGAPDLSVIAKGRAGFSGPVGTGINQLVKGIGGPEYIYSILTHYTGETKEEAGETFYENTAFPGGWIKMPPPLSDDQVTYADGHPATVSDEAKDVSAFLMWTAEPKMMARKQVGLVSVIFLIVLTTLLYLTNKRLWWSVKHPASRDQTRRETVVTHTP